MRVCCYGSSSAKTPAAYVDESYKLGQVLAKRGHVCVNGAGKSGCMGAMNNGASDGNGDIIGVIHEMFIGKDKLGRAKGDEDGSHPTFRKEELPNGENPPEGAPTRAPMRELLIAGGHDLQERKRLLVENADCICVLPGGCGTFDELWEMACSRGLGLMTMPIVCVSVNGFYAPFEDMLKRAYKDNLLYSLPDDIIHFEPTAEKAVEWLERKVAEVGVQKPNQRRVLSTSKSRMGGFLDNYWGDEEESGHRWLLALTFTTGVIVGAVLSVTTISTLMRRSRK
mmetsp:Transcript_24367/g.37563  ORF Transcript_24367/g.37563 Transcript_24367/m.37563 type:complete len:282 (-) Transcript_24367:76-921(-)|eukprot:CAMPEP_0196801656 /NCGR_PEP_ID=MMETSP1362-20130617/1424_1 /TAXON_ID=163516 /ORGANISM="Leptocylindrus danicus, Strain CCMP1856" /LENGTH=281 /DNA_ID=CAMNT_0042172719 /DNA_START=37 /DNA_END=882 /DNA_ORIENTATION=-